MTKKKYKKIYFFFCSSAGFFWFVLLISVQKKHFHAWAHQGAAILAQSLPVQCRKMPALPYILAVFMTSLTQTAGHKMAGCMAEFGDLQVRSVFNKAEWKTAVLIIFNSIPVGKAHVATLLQVSFNVWTVSILNVTRRMHRLWYTDLKQNEAQSAHAESTHRGGN